MMELTKWVFLVLVIVQFMLGMLGNGFIGLVNGISWFKNKRFSLLDFIITLLALSRIIILCILLTDEILVLYFYETHEASIMMQFIDILWTFANHLSIWFATCLSVFYCLKIANFSSPTFLWFKWRVSRIVVGMLLGAVFLSCASTMSLIHEFKVHALTSGISHAGNASEHFKMKRIYKLVHILANLWDLPPLIVSLVSYFLLFLSLGRHIRQMQHICSSPRDTTSEAHKKVIKTTLSFFFLFLLYYISFLIAYSSSFLPEAEMNDMVGDIIIMFYPAGHSVILIMGNNKLKQTFVEIWYKLGPQKAGSKRPIILSMGRGWNRDPETPLD